MRKTTEKVKYVFIMFISKDILSTQLATLDVNIHQWAVKLLFLGFLHWKVPLCPLSILYSLEGRKSYV